MALLVAFVFLIVVCVVVAADASSLKKRGIVVQSGAAASPAGWAAGCFLLLIVFLPWYLVSRASAVNIATTQYAAVPPAPPYPATMQRPTYPSVGYSAVPPSSAPAKPVSVADELRKLDELRKTGALNDEEFESAKRGLLG